MEHGAMLKTLYEIEQKLPLWLTSSALWNSLDIVYEPPRVERLWYQHEKFRVYLHRIHPCAEALFHPHPWPSAVKILSGSYEMGVGYSGDHESKDLPPTIALTTVLCAGAQYEMIDRDGWHYVKPLQTPSLSLMITGPVWKRWSPKSPHHLPPLTANAKAKLLEDFQKFYPG